MHTHYKVKNGVNRMETNRYLENIARTHTEQRVSKSSGGTRVGRPNELPADGPMRQ